MRLKTTTDASDALLRGGFEPVKKHSRWLRLGGNKPSEVYQAWFTSDGFRGDWFVEIRKGTILPGYQIINGWFFWDFSNPIILKLA